MKNRAELLFIFQKFHAEVRTQFNTLIRLLRSDNAKEYLLDHSPPLCPHMRFFINPLVLQVVGNVTKDLLVPGNDAKKLDRHICVLY